MAAVVILASAAAVTFLAGTVLFVAGLMQPTGRRRRADEPTSAFGFLIRHAWKVLFPPSGTSYPRDQRMMAGGLMLMAIAALLAIGALAAAVASGSGQDSKAAGLPVVSTLH